MVVLLPKYTPYKYKGRSPAELFLKCKPRYKHHLLKPTLPEYAMNRVLRDDIKKTGFSVVEQVLVQCVRVPGEVMEVVGQNTYGAEVGQHVRFYPNHHLCRSQLGSLATSSREDGQAGSGEAGKPIKGARQQRSGQRREPQALTSPEAVDKGSGRETSTDQSHTEKPRTGSTDRLEKEKLKNEGGFRGFRRNSRTNGRDFRWL
ncbi:hypothetical protein PR048_018394 [Dryococelus australis]|uniref:Uncharacterized protein n=1 Tax=Dryococelus australis TaxID=614101 RepID=A0ABQ9HC67_9NEOP|nr:hypothetical protein PR048_018394 [Dryococelus australis]